MDILANLVVFSIVLALCSVIVELASILFIDRRLTREHDFLEERGTFGDQLNDYLIDKDTPEGPTNLEVITDVFASRLVTGMKAQTAGIASGDSRRASMVTNKVFDYIAANNPDIALARKIGEKLGLEDEDLELVIHALRKFGGGIVGSQHNPSSQM